MRTSTARVGRHYKVVYLPSVEITHYGRVSTRQHIGFASTNMAIGFVRYLRKSGCSRAGLTFYKVVVTLDAPLVLADKAFQYLWRRLLGRKEKAAKSLRALRGLGYFVLKGLGPFWKA